MLTRHPSSPVLLNLHLALSNECSEWTAPKTGYIIKLFFYKPGFCLLMIKVGNCFWNIHFRTVVSNFLQCQDPLNYNRYFLQIILIAEFLYQTNLIVFVRFS